MGGCSRILRCILSLSLQAGLHATQPDIFLKGKESLIGIELKLSAKSSIEQMLKYAMLFYFSGEHSGKSKACHLIYIGLTEFRNLFKGKDTKIHDLQQDLTVDDLPDKTRKGGLDLMPHKDNILNVAKNMTIDFINYQSLHDLFHYERNQIDTGTAYAETVAKLFDGINDEFLMRGLAKALQLSPVDSVPSPLRNALSV